MNKQVKKWFANKELFQQELAKGKKWEAIVAQELEAAGFNVTIPNCELDSIECDAERRKAAANSVDMYVDGRIIEVKSRNYRFTCADDFPFETIAVDTKDGFDRKADKPVVYICVSQHTGDMIALDVEKTREHWVVSKRFDTVRKIPVVSYDCHKKWWGSVADVLGGAG